MSSDTAVTVIGTAILSLLLAGYLAQQYLPPPTPKIVGIDLGTTYSCVAVYEFVTGNVRVIPVQNMYKSIPSVVAFRDNQILVGYEAQEQAERNPYNTVYDAKRFIGQKMSKEVLLKESKSYQFKIVEENGMPYFIVGPYNNRSKVAPEYIGGQIIKTLKSSAEANLSAPVTKCVLAVPADFDDWQRNYTGRAAQLAGLEVLRIISEPTAAAMSYGLHKKEGVNLIVVVDIGGGTSDVALLRIQGGMFLTQALAGNNHLGGQDFNRRLRRYLLNKLKWDSPSAEQTEALQRVVELAKLDLTEKHWCTVKIPVTSTFIKSLPEDYISNNEKFNINGNFVEYNLTRKEFEEVNQDLFNKITYLLEEVTEDSEILPEEVDEVVLVGGSTRIPFIRTLVEMFFGKIPNTSVDPELAVGYGVAIQAGILGGAWPLQVAAVELPTRVRKKILN